MEKSEIECCGTTHLHDSLVHQIEDGMPKEETIRELSDFFKVFGDMTRIKILCVLFQAELCVCDLAEVGNDPICSFTSTENIKADEVSKEQKRRKDGVLLAGRRAYTEHFESGNRAYNRVEAV